jgi:hypothetical protein
MKINWNQNPLYSTIDVDDKDRHMILLSLQTDKYSELLCDIDMYIETSTKNATPIDMKYITNKISGWSTICDMEVDDAEVERCVTFLQESHGGDCTCWPASCMKCYAESMLGVNTLEGLGKHSANKIMGAFSNNNTISDAIKILETEQSYTKTALWDMFTQEEYEKHIPRWKNEKEIAAIWLIKYKEMHGF